MKPILNELVCKYDALKNILETIDEEEQDESCFEALKALQADVKEVALPIAATVINLANRAEELKTLRKKLDAKIKSAERREAEIREYLLDNLIAGDITKIDGDYISVAVHKNRSSVDVYSENLIPPFYFREKVIKSVDKDAIKKDIEAGVDVQGAKLVNSK